MPREFVHWWVVDTATARLSPSPVKQLLQENRAAVLLGAMAPDAPYYYRLGTLHAVEKVAEAIHGYFGNDTRDSVRKIIATAAQAPLHEPLQQALHRRATAAMVLGLISHLVTDSIFHPMIFYFSGDYYHPDRKQRLIARRRHRVLEVFLDRAMREQSLWVKETSMLELFQKADSSLSQTWRQLDQSLPAQLDNGGEFTFWRSAFQQMALLQRAFANPLLGHIFSGLRTLAPGKLGCLAALFAYQGFRAPLSFADALEFRNPVTGEERRATLLELLEQATAMCCQIYSTITMSSDNQLTNVEAALEPFGGVSLNYGLPNVTSQNAQHYAPILSL